MEKESCTVALAGNPNVGKSTVFNALTGMRQHTGNWAGKTVEIAQGSCRSGGREYTLVDIPGAYSLHPGSAEEEVARDYILSGEADAVVVVCDAGCLVRNLNLVIQVIETGVPTAVCVNLIDEAAKKGISVDAEKLRDALGVPVVLTAARQKQGLTRLMAAVDRAVAQGGSERGETSVEEIYARAEAICAECVSVRKTGGGGLLADRILTGRWTAIPVMLLLLTVVFWLTITGANYPSEMLSRGLFWIQDRLLELFTAMGAPEWLTGVLVLSAYRVLAWVVAVMLPPMAIFFPLFTLLEDLGYLPRVAFNLDRAFSRCHACGKQALTMCMGFGCNAVGVTGCRIIDSPRERLIALLTNVFVPCNGRFPTITALIAVFFVAGAGGSFFSAAILTAVILLGIAMTFAVSRLLSATLLRGLPSSFTLELPPFRRPQIVKTIVRSVFSRTLLVLARAVAVAAPAGLVVWILANVTAGEATLLAHCANALQPVASFMGLDGVILLAFILGFPANEIVIPIAVMAYMAQGSIQSVSLSELKMLLIDNGWTWVTAVCTILFSLMHWPCSTTLLTIKKETGSLKWTLVSFVLPTLCGIVCCAAFAGVARLCGWG